MVINMKPAVTKPSLLFIVYSLERGGAERVISTLSNKLAHMECSVCVLLYRHDKEEYALDPSIRKLILENYDERLGNGLTRSLYRIRFIRKVLKAEKPAFVIPFMSGTLRDTLPATIGLPCTVIGTERSNPALYPRAWGARKIRDLFLALCNGVYLQNEGQRQYFSKKIIKKSFIIPNPLGEEFLGLERQPRNLIRDIITIGRLGPEKNQALLISAFGLARKSNQTLRLYIYGEGVLRENLQKQIIQEGLADAVFLMGRTDNVPQALEKADIFVLPSNFEGMPNALIEAMAAGLPCIATDCPFGPGELIKNGGTGLLTPLEDAEALSNAILWMANHPKEAYEMGIRAQEFVRSRFNASKVAEELIVQLKRHCQRGK